MSGAFSVTGNCGAVRDRSISEDGQRAQEHFRSGGRHGPVDGGRNVAEERPGAEDQRNRTGELASHSVPQFPPFPKTSSCATDLSSQCTSLSQKVEQILQRHESRLYEYKKTVALLSEENGFNSSSSLNHLLSQTETGGVTHEGTTTGSADGEVGSIRDLQPSNRAEGGVGSRLNIPTSSTSSFFYNTRDLELLKQEETSGYAGEHPNCGPNFQEQLTKSARCGEDQCEEHGCKQMKTFLMDIQNYCVPPGKHSNLLVHMYDHCVSCDDAACVYAWCHLQSREAKERHMLHSLTGGVAKVSLPLSHQLDMLKFDPRICFDCVPLEDEAWTRLCMLGRFSKAMLAKPKQQFMTEPDQYWVLKRVITEKPLSWVVYEKLSGQKNLQSMTPLLWATSMRGGYVVCSTLDGISLNDHLQACESVTSDLVGKIVFELSKALMQLHGLDIVYLYWSCKNVLVYQALNGNLHVKLINFDCSSVKGTVLNSDSRLPVHLLPPELLSGGVVELSCDLWGVGCLLYEVVTRRRVWHSDSHLSRSELKTQMRAQPHPLIPDFVKFRPLFEMCWKVDPRERVDAVGLHRELSRF